MTIGIHTRNYLRKVALCCSVTVFLGGSAVLVDRALAQGDGSEATSADEHILSIYDRGEERVVLTKARTIREALKSAGVEISVGQDTVEPSLDEELVAPKYNVNIFRARPVTVVDGTVRKRITTAEQTPDQIAKAAKVTLHTEDTVTLGGADNLLLDGADTVMTIDRATELTFTQYGKKTTVRTQAATVGEFLKEKSITLGENDFLSVPVDQAISAGMSIELWREGKQTMTQEEEVDFPVEKVRDADRPIGYREVKDEGEKGTRNVTYEIEMKNGVEISRKEIASVTTKEPKKQVEVIGAKSTGGLTKAMGVKQFTDSNGVTHRETYYDLPMSVVMGNCGAGGYYSVREDGVKVDRDGYVIIAANLGNYPRCSVVETSVGAGKVYDTGGFASVHPHGFDIATDWTNYDGR